MRFRAVFFDAGETLVHPAPSFPALFASVIAEHGEPRDLEDVTSASALIRRRFSDAAAGGNRWTLTAARSEAFWRRAYGEMLERLDLPSGDGVCDSLYDAFTNLANYALFDDVLPVLDELRSDGVRLGVVSNFEPWLDELLGTLGVRDRFSVCVISGVEGVEKPDPAIYRLALDRAGVEPAEAAFVGDDPRFDVDPPRSLGMTPVLIDRRRRNPDHAGARIEDLRHLPDLLRSR
jgi:putative hydrolase of the HAD superfamily